MGRLALLLIATSLFIGCAHFRNPPPLPVASSVALEQLVVYSDFNLPQQHRLLQELNALRDHVSDELALSASDEPIHVYLFKTPRRYKAFIREHYPEFPQRRAFFVETDTRLSVYAFWGDQIVEDLRHEVSHGYMHAVVPNLPLWLDEGLAEFFEVNPAHQGLHQDHLEQLIVAMQDENWEPSLERLEQLSTVAEMEQIHYAEAWAWGHFLLRTDPAQRQWLLDYLQELKQRKGVRPFSAVIAEHEAGAAQLLTGHLRRLHAQSGGSLP